MRKIVLKCLIFMIAVLTAALPQVSLYVGAEETVQNLLNSTDETTGFIVDAIVIDHLKDNLKNEKFGYWSDLGSGKNVFVDNEVGLFGHGSIRLDNSADRVLDTSKRHTTVGTTITLEKGKTYTFQAWVKTQDVDRERVYILVEYYQQGHKSMGQYNQQSRIIGGTNDWTLLHVTFTVPDIDFYTVLCQVCLWGATGVAWFDGLAVTESDGPIEADKIVNHDGSTLQAYAPPTPTPTKPADRDFVGEYMQVTYVPEKITPAEKPEADTLTKTVTWTCVGLVTAAAVAFLVIWRIKESGSVNEDE